VAGVALLACRLVRMAWLEAKSGQDVVVGVVAFDLDRPSPV
jgi:hypothetical protein